MTLEDLLAPLRSVDWGNLDRVQQVSSAALTILASQPDKLGALFGLAMQDDALLQLSEHYDILDKVVLHDDETGFRLRLHVFSPGYFDRPHNHRWVYTTMILRGAYRHRIFLIDREPDGAELPVLSPLMNRVEQEGDCYTLATNVAHSISAAAGTISLVVRGPATSDHFFVADNVTGKSWKQYGATLESTTERAAKTMSPERLLMLKTYCEETSIIA